MFRKNLLRFSCILLLVNLIVCEYDWWETASFYQIYPRSFQDSDGNGIGDLNGITDRLAYLKEIGIEATWLSPIFKSPMSDFGYDISNFTDIDPIFGTLKDFDELIKKAKKIGIKIILDFVPNHSSDECEWFKKSINREDGYDDFYVWDDGKPNPVNLSERLPPSNWLSVFGGSAWTWNVKRKQFYFHQFQDKQPDLNYRSTKVKETMKEVLKFWLDRGVDGFRIDAVPHIFETVTADGTYPDEPKSGSTENSNQWDYLDHIYTRDLNETIDLIYEWRAFLEDYKKQNGGSTRILLAEAYSPLDIIKRYFGNGTHYGAHIPFNFQLFPLDKNSNAKSFAQAAWSWVDAMWYGHKSVNWVLGNHDNPRISNRFGKEKIDLMNFILLTLPGASVTYYGEEIGMENGITPCTTSRKCDERDPERTPFQWNNGVSAGFSTNSTPWLPVAANYKDVNVMKQRRAARSNLNIFKGLQSLRKSKAFTSFKAEIGGWGFSSLTDNIFQVSRVIPEEAYLVLVNLGNRVETYEIEQDPSRPEDALDMEYVLVNGRSPHRIGQKVRLEKIFMLPYEAVILRWQNKTIIN